MLKPFVAILAITLLLAEAALWALGSFGLAPRDIYPETVEPVFWDDIRRDTGVWRYPDAELHARSRCYDVIYRTNAYGARDRTRAKTHAGQRIVLLGDSMIEGLGVARAHRVSDLLELRTGVEHLNFATSGDFGPIQQWLIYQNLARQFEHTAVYIFAFPTNDFSDNNPLENDPRRYRPYLRDADGADRKVYYPVLFEQRLRQKRSRAEATFNWFANRVRVLSAARWLFDPFASPADAGGDRNTNDYSDYTPRDLRDALFAYDRIVDLAGNRSVYLFLIPFAADFAAVDRAGGYHALPLARDLANFADGFDNVMFMDLLEPLYESLKRQSLSFAELTLECDGHWGELGNRLVADAVYNSRGGVNP